jgi:hypothetical protein
MFPKSPVKLNPFKLKPKSINLGGGLFGGGFWRRALFALAFLLPLSLLGMGCDKKGDDDDKSGGSSAPKTFELKEVGVSIQAPGDWEMEKRGSRYVVRGGRKGVFVRRSDSPAPKTPAEAAKRFVGSKILEKEKLKSGGIYLLRNTKFPNADGGEPMWLKYVSVVIPLAKGEGKSTGSATCQVQLLKKGDKELYERICKSMKLL